MNKPVLKEGGSRLRRFAEDRGVADLFAISYYFHTRIAQLTEVLARTWLAREIDAIFCRTIKDLLRVFPPQINGIITSEDFGEDNPSLSAPPQCLDHDAGGGDHAFRAVRPQSGRAHKRGPSAKHR